MKLLTRAILASMLWGSFASGANAQEAAVAVDEPWTFTVGLSGSYEGNALFTGPGEGEEFAHYVSTGLSRAWLFPRGNARLSAGASQPFYQESTSLNDLTYSVGGGLSYALTRRLSWSGASTVSSGLARDSPVLNEAGLVLSSTSVVSSSSSSSFAYQLSRRSNLSWGLSLQGVGFSSALFTGGQSVGSVLSFGRQVAGNQTIGVTQEYFHTFSDETSNSIYGLLGTWSATVGRGWTVFANAGVRPYSIPGESGWQLSTALSAGVTKPVRPGQSFGVSYNKSIEQTFGIDQGNHLVQMVSGNYSLALRRNLSASFGGMYSRSTNPLTPDVVVVGQAAQVGLSYQVIPNLGISVGSSVYGRTDPPEPHVTSFRTFVAATYGVSWR